MKKICVVVVGFVLIFSGLLSGCFGNNQQNKALDSDGDGYPDSIDAFPFNASEWKDVDGDGVGDNSDAFPHNANESRDSDGDGFGDNKDAFPFDSTEWRDSDGDGVGDNADYFPYDPARWEKPVNDAFLNLSTPYLDTLVLNSSEVRGYANNILYGVNSSGRECQVNALYRDVLMNYTCTSAPMGTVALQTPQQTISEKEGTCEDLSILLCSLLSNVGIPTSLVFTNTHVYALAYDINPDALWNCSNLSLIHYVEARFGEPMSQHYVQTYSLPYLNMLYVGGEEEKTFTDLINYMTINYRIESDQPLHLFVVPTQKEFFALRDGDIANFTHYAQWEKVNLMNGTGSLQLFTFGGIILVNEGASVATVDTDFLFTLNPSFYGTYNKKALSVHNVSGKIGVLLDPTLGEYGFPGYDVKIVGEKTVIDPVTKKYFILM